MPYKFYLFDFDYTLANSEKAIVTCFQRVLKQNNYPDTPDDTIKRTIGMPMEDALSLLTGEHDASQIARLQEQFSVEANVLMTANTFFFPETIPTLSSLKAAGAKVGIISTKKRSRIREKLLADDVDNLIDIIIGREDVALPKPSPEGLLLALDRLQAEKSEVLYTGDSLIDAHTAKNAHVDFAAVTTGMTTAADFADVPHKKILKNLAELL